MTLLGKIVRRGPADWLLVAEALVLLAFFKVCLGVVPVRKIIRTMTRGPEGEPTASEDERGLRVAKRVAWAVSAAARHSVVKFVCFPQTLAGYTMLRWRGVKSTMVYGVARSSEGELKAHTWLTFGDGIVTGFDEAHEYTAVERWS